MTPDTIRKTIQTAPTWWVANNIPVEERALFEGHCQDGRHTVLVYAYLFGQIRMRLTDKERPDSTAPEGHGSIVRELDTYKLETAVGTIAAIMAADDAAAYCESLARPWNTAFEGDRIRLDNEESEFRPS